MSKLRTKQQNDCELTAMGKPRGKPFVPGDPRLRQNMEARQAAEAGNDASEVSADDNSSLYEDMEHVRRYPKSRDRTQAQKDCRKWKQKDFRGFMSKLADLEKASVEQRRQGKKPEQAEEDEGAAACLELVERLLAEYKPECS
jgi:hypothetical protein